MNYVSFSDLNTIILKNLHKIPHDIDLIVGIPRSGMIPANLIALYLNKPFTDIDSFIEGRIYGCGQRGEINENRIIHKVLIVDDSIMWGSALNRVKEKLTPVIRNYDITYCAVIANEKSRTLVDIFLSIVPQPRIFQWNILHHPTILQKSCYDLDGVLCEDPPLDDDGPIYTEYIKNAIPKFIPSVPIDTIVTCRLEKYRAATEEWLTKNNVKYRQLIMLNMKSKKERLAWNKHGQYKGDEYKKNTNASLFVESSLTQAKIIAKVSRKPVFCIENFSLIQYEGLRRKIKKLLQFIKYNDRRKL